MKKQQVNKKITGGLNLDGEFRLRIVDGAVTITANPEKVKMDYWEADSAKQTTK